jgi:hypothetical protein
LLSALSAIADQAPVEDQSGYTSALQRELEGLVDNPSMSRVIRRVRRESANYPVSNAVPEGMKLQ